MDKKKILRHLIIILAVTFAFLAGCAALVYRVDPFFHYHAPLKDFPYVVDNQLTQNPGMAEHMEYDSVILGSSMTVNFETDWFEELYGLNTLKLSYSSAYPRDISNILEKIYEPYDDGRQKDIKEVYLGLDIITYSGDVDETKYPIPGYLYDKNPLNDINYLLNKDVLLEYVLRPMVDPEPTDLSHVYASWWTEEYYNEEWVLRGHDPAPVNPVPMEDHAFDSGIEENLKINIIPYIEGHPETTYHIFFPPYSILFWNDVLLDNRLNATLNAYRCVCDQLSGYDNVYLYYFPAEKETVTDLNNYADYTHYKPDINRYMTECFGNGTDLISRDKNDENGIEGYLKRVEEMLDGYDFETLNKKLAEYHG
ncbi:MAG: hypothetical protein K5888_11370 [Lachnospiraceae bacterium]|nr:hypothetical protein [Lachnospiraceae bacterium]